MNTNFILYINFALPNTWMQTLLFYGECFDIYQV